MFFITDINMYKKLMPVDNACALIDKAAIDELLLSLSLADGMSCTGEVKYLSDAKPRKVKVESNMFSAFMESEILNRLQDVWHVYLCLEFMSDEYTSETVHLFLTASSIAPSMNILPESTTLVTFSGKSSSFIFLVVICACENIDTGIRTAMTDIKNLFIFIR